MTYNVFSGTLNPTHLLPCYWSGSGSTPKFNQLFTGPLPTFPENFMQIRWEVFAQSC